MWVTKMIHVASSVGYWNSNEIGKLTDRGALCKNRQSNDTSVNEAQEVATCACNAYIHQQLSICNRQNDERETPFGCRLRRSTSFDFCQ